ncbi:MAG TPA: response regulator [Oligoflexus sp.]|uniref:response regulator n=1 Tax=Oligoflexus sp. TaxID=1971216 RepID=UPI002D269FF5|nr:response regulator [Oligoflexus sp.]HYX31748.1 response regulator [Oligoflexus sp.]
MSEPLEEKAHADTSMPFPGIKALICEDDELNQKIMQRLLAKFGVESDLACDGREGFDKLACQSYNIVFVDLQMPVLDGPQLAKMVRDSSNERIARTPLVAVTGSAHYFQDKALAETGFADYIIKPITPHLVLQTLERLLVKN